MHLHRRLLGVGLLTSSILMAAPGAHAVVPPTDCGMMSVHSKRYQVKVDQISCGLGRGYAQSYLSARRKPRGYTCHQYPMQRGRVFLYCSSGRKVFFVIRR